MLEEIRETENEQTFDDRESVASSSSPPDLSDRTTFDFEQKRPLQGTNNCSRTEEDESRCFIAEECRSFQLFGVSDTVHQNPDQERYPHQFQRRSISLYDVSFYYLCYSYKIIINDVLYRLRVIRLQKIL